MKNVDLIAVLEKLTKRCASWTLDQKNDVYHFFVGGCQGAGSTAGEAILSGLAEAYLEARSSNGRPELGPEPVTIENVEGPLADIDMAAVNNAIDERAKRRGIDPRSTIFSFTDDPRRQAAEQVVEMQEPVVPNAFMCWVPGRAGYESVKIYGHVGPGMFRVKLASPAGDERHSEWCVPLNRFLVEHRDAVAATLEKTCETVETVGVDEFVDRCQKCENNPCRCAE